MRTAKGKQLSSARRFVKTVSAEAGVSPSSYAVASKARLRLASTRLPRDAVDAVIMLAIK